MRKLYIQQKVFKILDHYPILDENQSVIYQVDQEFVFFGRKIHVSRPDGRPVFTLEKEILTFMPRHHVHLADGREFTLQNRFTFIGMDIDILPEELGLRLEGQFMNFDFDIFLRGERIASIERAWLSWGDYYELTIFEPAYEELAVACAIAVDSVLDDRKNN